MGIWKSTIEACNDNMNWKPNIATSEQFRTVINHREEKSFCSRKVHYVRNHEEGNLAVAACSSPTPQGAIGRKQRFYLSAPPWVVIHKLQGRRRAHREWVTMIDCCCLYSSRVRSLNAAFRFVCGGPQTRDYIH